MALRPDSAQSRAYRLPLPSHPIAAEQARILTRLALTEWDMNDIADDALIVPAELVSNAVKIGDACRPLPSGCDEPGPHQPHTPHDNQRSPMPKSPDADSLLTPREVAELFGVRTTTIARWSRAGRLTPMRPPGGHRRYSQGEVRQVLAEETPHDERQLAQDAARLYGQGWEHPPSRRQTRPQLRRHAPYPPQTRRPTKPQRNLRQRLSRGQKLNLNYLGRVAVFTSQHVIHNIGGPAQVARDQSFADRHETYPSTRT